MSCIFDSNFPGTDYNKINLDWFLQEFNKIQHITSDMLNDNLRKLILEAFNELMPDAAYDAETETIIIKMAKKEKKE
jgi:hypothetical protein